MSKLGIVTFNIAKDWNLETLLQKCTALGLAGVELRTAHAHGVEIALSRSARAEVKRKFADTPVKLVGLGSVLDYHTPDPDELKRKLAETREYIKLAADVGATGIKVRPNAFPPHVARERTMEQIGSALREAGVIGAEHGVEIRLEVHGRDTAHPPCIRQMLDMADHPNVYACWNSNPTDMDEHGAIDGNFAILRHKIGLIHMHELYESYPYRRLFELLRQAGYNGFYLAEIAWSTDPNTVLKYYKRLFEELQTSCGG